MEEEIDNLLRNSDETVMPLPGIDCRPHLLISKVRKQYLEHIINLLIINYESNQKLLGKNIYLPSAIWRCAKYIEMYAAQACMVVTLYRTNILEMINELKADTAKGKLNRKLLECLQFPSSNEKKIQTDMKFCDSVETKRKKPKKSDHHIDILPENKNVPLKLGTTIPDKQITEKQIIQSEEQNIDNFQNISLTQRNSIDSPDHDVMMQLEQMFGADTDQPDDKLFDSIFCDETKPVENLAPQISNTVSQTVMNDQATKFKSLDERLALLASTGVLNTQIKHSEKKNNLKRTHEKTLYKKWLCEEYHQKLFLNQKLDDIKDVNRKKHIRITLKYQNLFGELHDDEILSPLDETREFVQSCKERITPWIVKNLTQYYVEGRIKGRVLFKSLAKFLIDLIYDCSKYPSEHDIKTFIADFMKTHDEITCEADFKNFFTGATLY